MNDVHVVNVCAVSSDHRHRPALDQPRVKISTLTYMCSERPSFYHFPTPPFPPPPPPRPPPPPYATQRCNRWCHEWFVHGRHDSYCKCAACRAWTPDPSAYNVTTVDEAVAMRLEAGVPCSNGKVLDAQPAATQPAVAPTSAAAPEPAASTEARAGESASSATTTTPQHGHEHHAHNSKHDHHGGGHPQASEPDTVVADADAVAAVDGADAIPVASATLVAWRQRRPRQRRPRRQTRTATTAPSVCRPPRQRGRRRSRRPRRRHCARPRALRRVRSGARSPRTRGTRTCARAPRAAIRRGSRWEHPAMEVGETRRSGRASRALSLMLSLSADRIVRPRSAGSVNLFCASSREGELPTPRPRRGQARPASGAAAAGRDVTRTGADGG